MCGYGWGNGWGSGWGWGGAVMSVLMVLLVVAMVVAVIFAVRYLSGSSVHRRGGAPAPEGMRAEDRLADRFARGEIDEDEFRRRMTLLREHR
ncbi:putative membrane protein [Mycolicibacterium chubuense NBB4]|uniref:Putative membrane protein n=1 Tax=Mycolicibacterium chubuense (strain NBB4) TaxID=710421 RepID=I4BJI3_MYCCN|nr:SHOCT domain-containing protein [Mycolicibacterium chubuense]AFM17440.1 putative membrane protein [Mycolicibacterium chubuense NBB4]